MSGWRCPPLLSPSSPCKARGRPLVSIQRRCGRRDGRLHSDQPRRRHLKERAMEQRILGRTGQQVSVVGLGTWQLGADWGEVPESVAREVLETAAEEGVTFFDTADVYGDGRSEQVLGAFLADHRDEGFVVATKMGRRVEQLPENYVLDSFRAWSDRSRRNLGVDRLDLVQLHCPPSAVIDDDATYD